MRKILHSTTTLILTIPLLVVGPMAVGQEKPAGSAERRLVTPGEINWQDGPASLPRGAQIVVLEGDPSMEGPFTMRLKMPDGYRIPPHTHPKTERVTVLSGTFRVGMGDKFDATALRALPTGSVGIIPVGMRHFAQAEGETVIQLHGTGPWDIIYVNPADDPRKTLNR